MKRNCAFPLSMFLCSRAVTSWHQRSDTGPACRRAVMSPLMAETAEYDTHVMFFVNHEENENP